MKHQEALARAAVRRALRNLPWLFSTEGNRQVYREHVKVQDVEMLVGLARAGDKDALDVLRKQALALHKGALDAGLASMEVPSTFHELIWEIFIYGPPKAKRGTSPKDTFYKYRAIALLVKIVRDDFGFQEYRNPEHRGDKGGPMTACRLVAEELELSERRVEEIWARHKASVTSLRRPN